MELTHTDVLNILPDRDLAAHKGDFGRVLLLCGSRGYIGAAALAAMGALRCGAGLIYLGVPESIYAIEAVKLNEPVVFPLPEEDGTLCAKSLDKILELLPKIDAVLMGCGMGCSSATFTVVEQVLKAFSGPVVLDADGINVLSGHIDVLRGRTGITILTPHPVEFQRVGGVLMQDRIRSAVAFAEESNSLVLLKG
ncbi:MAG: NAD(P)H-hydrate dehydratase, partial [Oscillospiraceae bacterium]|nr:NAD(P)H-hydrate dehydratase [Oscillospiraceae bacterium]